jgi:putative acetyltransferase
MLMIRLAGPSDLPAIAAVHRQAFGGETEGRLVQSLHHAGLERVSLVALDDGAIVGDILFSEIQIRTDSGPISALSLAPLGVLPAHQRRGIGTALVARGLEACTTAGHRIILVLGDPAYYTRFGFRVDLASRLHTPFSPAHFMALELQPGALENVSGQVVYPAAFDVA